MKRAIAILLLVVCFALPFTTFADNDTFRCNLCGGHNCKPVKEEVPVKYNDNTVFHKIMRNIYAECSNCYEKELRGSLFVGLEKHTKKKGSDGVSYYHVSPYLTIVYDVCACGQRFNPREVYSY